MNRAIERPHCDDPGGPVELRSSLAFERRLARGHRVQGIIWMDRAILLAYKATSFDSATAGCASKSARCGPTSGRQLTRAAINLELLTETQRRRAATRPATNSLASWLISIFTCAAASGPKTRARGLYERRHVDARQHGGHGGAHGWRVRGRALSATTRKR